MPDRAERRRQQRAAGKPPIDEPKMTAAIALLGRTGAADIQIRYSDDEDPTVWFVVARYRTGPDGRPVRGDSEPNRWDAAAGHLSPKKVAAYLHRLADKLDTHGGRAWEMVDLLASSGLSAAAIGAGSRSSDTTSSTERAALAGAEPANGDQRRTNMWAETDERMDKELRLLWRAGLAVEATVDNALAHGTTADKLPPGTGYCTCGGDDPKAPTWCGTFCAPRQNGSSDRLVTGLAPTCYRRFARWRETHPDGTVADWKHATRRAREVADERAAQLAAGRAALRG